MSTADKPDWLVSSSETPNEPAPAVLTTEFVAAVYQMYARYFWDFYKLVIPPTLLALLVYTARPWIVAWLTSGLTRADLRRPTVMLELFLTNFGTFFLAWFFEAFTLAAVSDVVGALYKGAPVPEGDGYVKARERIREVFKIALATYVPFVFGFMFLMIVVAFVVWRLSSQVLVNYWFNVGLAFFEMLLVAAGLIGFAFAVPLVMTTDVTAGKALRTSWRLTDGHEGKLTLFVAESLVGAFLAMYAMNWIGYIVFSRISLGGWESWVLAITTALVGAAAQAPMLIAFALLYFQTADSRTD